MGDSKGGGDGVRTGRQQLAQDQCREMALLFGQGVGVFLCRKAEMRSYRACSSSVG